MPDAPGKPNPTLVAEVMADAEQGNEITAATATVAMMLMQILLVSISGASSVGGLI